MTGDTGRARRVLGAFALMSAFKVAERTAEDADDPQIVSGNPRVERLAELAIELSRTEEDDGASVRRLTEAAGRRRRELRKAAAIVRFGGGTRESAISDRANRLGRPPLVWSTSDVSAGDFVSAYWR